MAMSLLSAQRMLDGYINAEAAVLEGKSITFAGRAMTMENLSEIRKGRQEWERKVNALSRPRCRAPYKLATFE